MRLRAGFFAVLLCIAAASNAQNAPLPPPPQIWQIDLVPSGHTFAATQPILANGVYSFQSWPEYAQTRLKEARVRKVGLRIADVQKARATVYQIDLNPSGQVIARDQPVLKNGSYVYRTYRDGTIMSVRQADVRKISALSGEAAYWAAERVKGETPIGTLAMQGGSAITISSPVDNSAQAGAQSTSNLGQGGINGAPVGNWQYQGTPGTSDAYGPANATVNGGVPTMPAATNGSAPPTQPQ